MFLVLAFVCLFLAARLVFGAPSDVWTEVDQTKSAGGAKVTLERAYADERFVAVDLRTQPGRFAPALYDDTVGNEAEFEPYVQITDASGQDFDSVGGGIWLPPRGTGAEAVFDAPEGLEGTGREHRFRLEVPLSTQQKLVAKPGPFVFDFEVPVAEAPTIAVDQQVEAEGIVMTLERVVNSPVLPQAIVCFESPDAKRFWMPWLQHDPIYSDPVALGNALGRMALGKREV